MGGPASFLFKFQEETARQLAVDILNGKPADDHEFAKRIQDLVHTQTIGYVSVGNAPILCMSLYKRYYSSHFSNRPLAKIE